MTQVPTPTEPNAQNQLFRLYRSGEASPDKSPLMMALSHRTLSSGSGVVLVAFSADCWESLDEKQLRLTLGKIIQTSPIKGLAAPTRVHRHAPKYDAFAEQRALWVMVGPDGLYFLIKQSDELQFVSWDLLPTFVPGRANGSHEALRDLIGRETADAMAIDLQGLLARPQGG